MNLMMNLQSLTSSSLLPDQSKSGIDAWSYTILLPQLVTLLVTTFIIMMLCICYYRRIRMLQPMQAPSGLALFVEIFIKWVEKQVVDLLGPKYKNLTIYFIFLLLYIGIGNLLSIVGFSPTVTAYTVPLSLGIVTFLGIYYFGLKYQRLAFFKRYLNPMELLTQFVPLVSISFRLFGNITGGTIIMMLFTKLTAYVWGFIPIFGAVDLLGGMLIPFLSLYFDIFAGLVQAYIFAILTFAYWAIQMGDGSETTRKKEKKQKTIKLKVKQPEVLVN